MTHFHASRVRPWAAIGVLIAALTLGSCYNPFAPRIAPVLGFSKPAPVPTSASNLLRLFEWCYNNKAITEYREIFTADYRFLFSPLDSAGADYRGIPWTREDEMISTTQLFVGGSADQPDYAQWDPTGRWHTNIRTQVVLSIQTGDGNAIDISGAANFYMVRGDSAVIPEELHFGPDPNRWYIRKWADETAQDIGGGIPQIMTSNVSDLSIRRLVGAAIATHGMGNATVGRPVILPAAAGDVPVIASWGYAKEYYRRQGGMAPLRAGPLSQRH